MKKRIANEGKELVTTYPNEKMAESVIGEVIMKNEKEIASWFEKLKNKPFSKKDFDEKLDMYTGYKVDKAGNKVELNKATV